MAKKETDFKAQAKQLKAIQKKQDAEELEKAHQNVAKAKEGVDKSKAEFRVANNPKTGSIGKAVKKHFKVLGKEIVHKGRKIQKSNLEKNNPLVRSKPKKN